jgi:hypothetical protein
MLESLLENSELPEVLEHILAILAQIASLGLLLVLLVQGTQLLLRQ